MAHPTVAGPSFGNKEDMTTVLFSPSAPVDVARADFNSEGKLIDAESVAAGASHTSLSAKVVAHPGHVPLKTIYVESNQPGTFVIEVMLDESERILGQPVWRKLTNPAAPIAVVAAFVASVTFQDLARQFRVVFTANGGNPGPATVNAWIFSIA